MLHLLTIHELHHLLQTRQISSAELTEGLLNHLDSIEPTIGAFITLTEDLARHSADRADKELASGDGKALTGIPMQIKDLISTKGIRTTCASKMLENYVPIFDATVMERLYLHTPVMVGKGNLDEFAMGSSTETSAFHPTHNPWDLERVPGGSSGGGAAAVAASEVIFALGSDTGGSIRQPAALCGITGLKPTYGLVSRYGLVAFASSFDQIGPLTRDVEDSALVLNVIAGYDPRDSTSIVRKPPNYLESLVQDVKGLRIGLPQEYFGTGIDPAVEQAVRNAAELLRSQGAIIEDCSLPLTRYALAVYYIIAPAECSANLARYDGVKYGYSAKGTKTAQEMLKQTRAEGFGQEVKRRIMLGTYALSSGYYDAYYQKGLKVRSLISDEFATIFSKYDALLTPTSPTPAFRIGERINDPVAMYNSDLCTLPANIAGIPALSVPCGFSDGLPIGMQIMGRHSNESILFQIGYTYQQITDWHKKRPFGLGNTPT